jgi:YbgC/YbaW family acyl-CoA thioester hydrolase
MAYEFKIVRRVEFSDTDMAGIMHYSNFFRFMETAEHGFFRSLGFSVIMDKHAPPIGWPRVHAECDYKKPLRFEDEVEVHLLVKEKRSKTISYQFRFRKTGEADEAARGLVTVVCVTWDAEGRLSARGIPKFVSGKIEEAPADLLA